MAKKLTKKQAEKLELIKAGLLWIKKEYNSCVLIDQDVTNVYELNNIYYNATGLFVAGFDVHRAKRKEHLYNDEINAIFRACKKDDDFNDFLKNNK